MYSGKTMVIGPHIVVRGNEKNYARFMNYNLPEIRHIDVAYFEDAVAKAILFKAADKRYGTKVSGNQIGELKQVVVPYTLSLLNIITNGKLDLYKIWKNQHISDALSEFIYELMKQVNKFIIDKSPVSHYIEWAKKEECWVMVKEHCWSYNLQDIKEDCIDEKIRLNATIRQILRMLKRPDYIRKVLLGPSHSRYGKRLRVGAGKQAFCTHTLHH